MNINLLEDVQEKISTDLKPEDIVLDEKEVLDDPEKVLSSLNLQISNILYSLENMKVNGQYDKSAVNLREKTVDHIEEESFKHKDGYDKLSSSSKYCFDNIEFHIKSYRKIYKEVNSLGVNAVEKVDQGIEKMYKDNCDLIINYLTTYQKQIETKFDKTKKENVKLTEYLDDVKKYLKDAKFIKGYKPDTQGNTIDKTLTIQIIKDSEYKENGALGSYAPFKNTITLPSSVDQDTMMHEIVHALTFNFDVFFLNQIGMSKTNVDKIAQQIFFDSSEKQMGEIIINKTNDLHINNFIANGETLVKLMKADNSIMSTSKRLSHNTIEVYLKSGGEKNRDSFWEYSLKERLKIDPSLEIGFRKEFDKQIRFWEYNSYVNKIYKINVDIQTVKNEISALEYQKSKLSNIFKKRDIEEQIQIKNNLINTKKSSINYFIESMEKYPEFLNQNFGRNYVQQIKQTEGQYLNNSWFSELYYNFAGKGSDYINQLTNLSVVDHTESIKQIEATIKKAKDLLKDPGDSYMGAFEITARFWELRLELYKEGIVDNLGDSITFQNIEDLLKLKQDYYENNNTYDLLDNIKLDENGKIPADKVDYVKMIVDMNNNSVVDNSSIDRVSRTG